MPNNGVGRNRGRGGAGWVLQQGSGEDTQMNVMELTYRSLFNHNQQVNSASVNKRTESTSVSNGFINN